MYQVRTRTDILILDSAIAVVLTSRWQFGVSEDDKYVVSDWGR